MRYGFYLARRYPTGKWRAYTVEDFETFEEARDALAIRKGWAEWAEHWGAVYGYRN